MDLKELNPPLTELPAGQMFFRVQLLRARPVVDAARRSGVPLLDGDASD